MKTAITVTIDIECAQYLDAKADKTSHYINQLILTDMQGHLEQKKRVWLKCPDCDLPTKDGDTCDGCGDVILAQQTLEGLE